MVASIVNFAVGAKDSGSDLGSSIGYAHRNLIRLSATVLTPSEVLHLHHPILLLAVVQVNNFVFNVNMPL